MAEEKDKKITLPDIEIPEEDETAGEADTEEEKADEEIPAGIIAILSDSEQAKAEISYDSMEIFVTPGFAYNMINKQDIIIRIRAAAQEVTGRSLKIQISEMTDNSVKPTRSIEELKKFKETRFV